MLLLSLQDHDLLSDDVPCHSLVGVLSLCSTDYLTNAEIMTDLTDAAFLVLSDVHLHWFQQTQTSDLADFDFDTHTDVLPLTPLQAVAKLSVDPQADALNIVNALNCDLI